MCLIISKPNVVPLCPPALSRSQLVCSIEARVTEKTSIVSKYSLKKKRDQVQRSSVRFLDARVVGTVPSRSSLSLEELKTTWYSESELTRFQNEIRALCKTIRDCQRSSGSLDAPNTTVSTCEPEIRGLENRICRNRQRNKCLSIWVTLKAQQRNNDPAFIATVAQKCNFLATELAIMQGARDYGKVYEPDKARLLLSRIKSFESNAFPIKLKRKSPPPWSYATPNTVAPICDRNVRRRPI